MATILDRVKKVVANQFGVDEDTIRPEMSLIDSFGADSLDVTEITMELEEEFSIKIPDAQAEKLLTIAQIVDYISTLEIDK